MCVLEYCKYFTDLCQNLPLCNKQKKYRIEKKTPKNKVYNLKIVLLKILFKKNKTIETRCNLCHVYDYEYISFDVNHT